MGTKIIKNVNHASIIQTTDLEMRSFCCYYQADFNIKVIRSSNVIQGRYVIHDSQGHAVAGCFVETKYADLTYSPTS